MLIEVTHNDIAFGVRSDCSECPIAVAVKRKFPKWEVQVGIGEINMSRTDENNKVLYARIMITRHISKWISAFDNMNPRYEMQKPLEFEMPDINTMESNVYTMKEEEIWYD